MTTPKETNAEYYERQARLFEKLAANRTGEDRVIAQEHARRCRNLAAQELDLERTISRILKEK